MIIAQGKKAGKKVLILGLSAANVSRLVQGEPILIRSETHGPGVPDGWEILVCFGQDEQSLYKTFRESGALDKAKIIKSDKLGTTDQT